MMSSDSSLDILKFFAERVSLIKVLENETSMSSGYGMNRVLETAKGK